MIKINKLINLIPLTAEAAETVPSLPATRTKIEAVTTTRSIIIIIINNSTFKISSLTDHTDWLPHEPDSSPQSLILGAVASAPHPHHVLDPEEEDEEDLHPEERLVRHDGVVGDGGEDAEHQAGQH